MDTALLDAIQSHIRSPFWDTAMPLVTHLGDFAIIWIAAAVVLLAQPRRRTYGIAVLVAVVAAAALGTLVLKPLFDRVRPFAAQGFMELLIPAPSGASFPSNHSMVSFAAAAVICAVPGKGRLLVAGKVAAAVAACLIAFSRLYLYVHYPSDVAVGAVLGVAIGFASVAAAKRLRGRERGALDDGAEPPGEG